MKKYNFADIEPYFLEKLIVLKTLLNSGHRFEVTILSLCYIDALGNLFMKGAGSKQRFMSLLSSHGIVNSFSWDKVNLVEFKNVEIGYKLKSKICNICYGLIEQYVDQKICQYDYSISAKCVEKDKYLSEVKSDIAGFNTNKTCKCNIISKDLSKCLRESTYGGILYNKYRCEGVHKGKFDGLWDSLSSHFSEPFYMDIQNSLPDFSIPPEFIIRTFEQCMASLKKIYRKGIVNLSETKCNA